MKTKILFRRIKNLLISYIKKTGISKLFFCILQPFFHKKTKLTADEALVKLQEFSPEPKGSCIKNKSSEKFEEKYDLAVVIPAYNAEKYLRECLDSAVNQKTKYSYQIIFVDDGSVDGTGKIAEDYAKKFPDMQVVHQENKGHSGARNTALERVNARYITFFDSDDILSENAVEVLMNTAYKYNGDIVQGSYIFFDGKMKKTGSVYPDEKLTKIENLTGHFCGKLYKKNLWEKIQFPEGFWFEDTVNSFIIYPQAESVYTVSQVVYKYRMNQQGVSKTAPKKPKCIDTVWVTKKLFEERNTLSIPMNQAFANKLLSQVMLNRKRTALMPEEIQECVFAVTRELFANCDASSFTVHKKLYNALEQGDYGIYQLYCKLF